MRVLQLLVSSVSITGALAAPRNAVQKRDLATIQNGITSVQTALGNLDTAVNGLTADPSTAPPILTASQGVQSAIEKATADISATDPLSLTDAIGLMGSASALQTAVQTTITGLTAKKPILDQLGVTSVAVTSLQTQKQVSTAFGSAIVSKVPAIGQGIAQQSIDQVGAILDKGIADLQAPAAAAPGGAAPVAASPVAAAPPAVSSGAVAGTAGAPLAAPSLAAPAASGIPAEASTPSLAAPSDAAAPAMGCMCPCGCPGAVPAPAATA